MKRHRCENPGCKFRYDITISNVSKEIVSKGYKCEYIAYFIKLNITFMLQKRKTSVSLSLNLFIQF